MILVPGSLCTSWFVHLSAQRKIITGAYVRMIQKANIVCRQEGVEVSLHNLESSLYLRFLNVICRILVSSNTGSELNILPDQDLERLHNKIANTHSIQSNCIKKSVTLKSSAGEMAARTSDEDFFFWVFLLFFVYCETMKNYLKIFFWCFL